MKTTITIIGALALSGCVGSVNVYEQPRAKTEPSPHTLSVKNDKTQTDNGLGCEAFFSCPQEEDKLPELVIYTDLLGNDIALGEPITQTTGTATWHGLVYIETWTQGESYTEDISFDIDFAEREIDGSAEIQRRTDQPLMVVHFGGRYDEQGNLTGLATESGCRHNDYVRIPQSCWFSGEYDFTGAIGKGGVYGEFSRSDITARSGVHGYINGSFIANPK